MRLPPKEQVIKQSRLVSSDITYSEYIVLIETTKASTRCLTQCLQCVVDTCGRAHVPCTRGCSAVARAASWLPCLQCTRLERPAILRDRTQKHATRTHWLEVSNCVVDSTIQCALQACSDPPRPTSMSRQTHNTLLPYTPVYLVSHC